MKKITTLILILAMVITCAFAGVQPVSAAGKSTNWKKYEKLKSGKCGKTAKDKVKYEIYKKSDSSVILRIYGKGQMKDYKYKHQDGPTYPWNLPGDDFNNSTVERVSEIIIEEGVTSIGNYAFYDCKNAKGNSIKNKAKNITVSLPSSLKTIGEHAFEHSSITKITLPKKLKEIKTNAFSFTDLTTVTIPDSVTKTGKHIFSYCSKLKSVKLGKNMKTIPEGMFFGTALKSIQLTSGITEIGKNAFADCKQLTNIDFGKKAKKIGQSAFANCGLENLFITANVEEIGANAFEDCRNLRKVYWMTKKVKKLEDGLFKNCTSLTVFDVQKGGGSIEEIGKETFAGCTAIEYVKLPDAVTTIGEEAFAKCISLERIRVGSKLKTVHETAFKKCVSLKEIQVPKDNLSDYETLLQNATAELNNIKIVQY